MMYDVSISQSCIVEEVNKNAGALDKIAWTEDGNCLAVSSHNGTLFVYAVERNAFQPKSGLMTIMRPLSSVSMLFSLSLVFAVLFIVLCFVMDAPFSDMLRVLFTDTEML